MSSDSTTDNVVEVPGEIEKCQPIFVRLMEIARASALEEMASGFAHELNQPLGAIATFAQAAERMLNKPEPMLAAAADTLKHISKEALGAGNGIRRIRKLFNREPARKVRSSIVDLLKELEPALAMLADRSGVQLTTAIAPDIPDVYIDRLRVQHVLFTLVQNAFEAAIANTARPPTVTIAVASDRYSVEVSVTDSGSGIPADARDQVFRPFFTTKSGGTGLGLASSRSIIEMHEGSIGFKSVPAGTKFWFSVPAFNEC
jgi:signal transduction histidine kinase